MNLENITINIHSSICIRGSKVVYFDPFKITEESHDADIIFVTHEHFDHFEEESIAKLQNSQSILVAPMSMKEQVLEQIDIDQSNCRFLNPKDMIEIDGMKVQAIPAYNQVKPFHPKEKGWLGYLITMDDVVYYIAGDTDAIREMEEITCDVALIPIGGTYTMNYQEAADCVAKLKTKAVIPTHYGQVAGGPEDGEAFRELVGEGVQVELKL